MKKKILLLMAFAFCFALSGRIDIFQHITKDGNGIDRNTIKVIASKSVIALANGFSGSNGSIDYE